MKRNKFFQRMACLLLALIMTLVSIPAKEADAASNEDAPMYEIIEITNREELLDFANNCHQDAFSANKQIMLMNDIRLEDEDNDFTIPVFKGIFEGNGHKISNFNSSTQGYVVGFFRYIQESAIVRNLTIEGNVSSEEEKECIGGLCGKNQGTIYDCTFIGTVNGKNQTGGIAAVNESTGMIRQCTARGRITGYYYTGGVCGKNYGTIDSCVNMANVNDDGEWVAEDDELGMEILSNISENRNSIKVTSGVDTGGIAGYSEGIIMHCKNRALIGYEHTGYNIGGIAGRQSGLVNDCINEGIVYGRKDVGGIVGQLEPFIELDESVSLRTEVNKLHEMIDKTLKDLEKTNNSIEHNIDSINQKADNSLDAGKKVTDHLKEYINENTDVANQAMNRLDTVIEMLPAVMDEMDLATDFAKNLNKAIQKLNEDLNLNGKLTNSLYQETDYARLTITDGVGGEITASTFSPAENAEVIFTVAAEDEYELHSFYAKDADGKDISCEKQEDGTYKMIMPAKNVVIYADFVYVGSHDTADGAPPVVLTSNVGGEATYTFDSTSGRVTVKISPDMGYCVSTIPVVTDKAQNDIPVSKSQVEVDTYEFTLSENQEPAFVTIAFAKQTHKQAVEDALDRINSNVSKLNEELSKMQETVDNIQDALMDENGNYKTLEQLRNDDELRGYMDELVDELSDAAVTTGAIMRDLSLIATIYGPYISDSADMANKDIKEATDIISQIFDCFVQAQRHTRAIINYLNAQSDLSLKKISQDMSDSMDHFQSQLQEISDSISVFNKEASANANLLTQDLRAINDQINVIMNLVIDKMSVLTSEDNDDVIYTDVSKEITQEEIEQTTTGKVFGCTNKGKVEGDRDCGGIAGAMSVDEEDLEENSAGNTKYSLGEKYLSKCIISDCTNEGNVVSKKDGAGGIVGYMHLGLVTESEAYGYIKSTEGDYVGGIAGESLGMIRESKASVVLMGNQNVGGIAGYAVMLHNCAAMPAIESATSRFGAIAGQIKEDDTSAKTNVYDNYFVSEALNGIDNISFSGIAEQVSYQDLFTIPNIPVRFRQLQVVYLVDGDVCKIENVNYGTTVENLSYPQYDKGQDLYVRWPLLQRTHITENMVLDGESLDYIKVLESDESREPLAYVEGTFREGTTLFAETISNEIPDVIKENDTYVIYDINLRSESTSLEDAYPLRIYNPYKNPAIYCLENDKWIKQDTVIRGNYLVTQLRNQTGRFLIVESKLDSRRMVLIGIGAGAMIISMLCVIVRVKKRKKNRKK